MSTSARGVGSPAVSARMIASPRSMAGPFSIFDLNNQQIFDNYYFDPPKALLDLNSHVKLSPMNRPSPLLSPQVLLSTLAFLAVSPVRAANLDQCRAGLTGRLM